MSERLEELRNIIRAAREELEGLELIEKVEKRTPLIGRYFKSLNLSGNTESFYRVVGLDNDGWLIVSLFELCADHSLRAQLTQFGDMDGFTEVTFDEYQRAFDCACQFAEGIASITATEARELLKEGE